MSGRYFKDLVGMFSENVDLEFILPWNRFGGQVTMDEHEAQWFFCKDMEDVAFIAAHYDGTPKVLHIAYITACTREGWLIPVDTYALGVDEWGRIRLAKAIEEERCTSGLTAEVPKVFFGSLSPNLEVHRSSHGKLFFYDQATHQTSYTDPRLTYVRESEDVNGELVAISSSQAGIRAGGAAGSWTEWSSSGGLRSLPSIVSSGKKTIKDTEMSSDIWDRETVRSKLVGSKKRKTYDNRGSSRSKVV